jgi:hypothetical protein
LERATTMPKLVFALVSVLLFHPFFRGAFILGGTDVLYAHYPNLLFGDWSLHEFGRFDLWNPYIFAGFDFTQSIHAPFLNPIFWPAMLVPERLVFHIVTLESLVFNWLIALLWYRIARLYLDDIWLAMLVGVVAQAGMFFWFLTTTLDGVPLYFLSSAAIYLILTHERRRLLANYTSLSLLLGLLFIEAHPLYVAAFALPVGIVLVVRCYPHFLAAPQRRLLLAFAAAVVTGLAMAAYRLVPVLEALSTQGVYLSAVDAVSLPSMANNAYFLLTQFIPLSFGIDISDASRLAALLGLPGRHTQAHNALYFGIFPLVIVYLALRGRNARPVVWLAVLFFGIVWAGLVAFQPLSDVANILVMPLLPDMLYRICSNFAFLFLLIAALRVVAALDSETIRKATFDAILLAAAIILFSIAMWARALLAEPLVTAIVTPFLIVNAARVGMIAIIFVALWFWWRGRFGVAGPAVWWAFFLSLVALGAVILFGRIAHILPANYVVMRVLSTGVALAIGAVTCVMVAKLSQNGDVTRARYIGAAGGLAFTVALMLPLRPIFSFGTNIGQTHGEQIFAIAIGTVLFLVLVAAAVTILHLAAKRPRLVLGMAPVILLMTMGDLIASYQAYSYVNTDQPFVTGIKTIYPDVSLEARFAGSGADFHGPFDAEDFRFNHLDTLAGVYPVELYANYGTTLHLPTYGGVDSDLPIDFIVFLTNFQPADVSWSIRGGINATLTDPRLLDLLGVAYDMVNGHAVHRLNALARFSAFSSYRVISDPRALLAELKDPAFDPASQLLLAQTPAAAPVSGPKTRFQLMPYASTGTSHLELEITADTPRAILFNDRYSPSWQANWNGAPIPVAKANGIFMGLTLPEGAGVLRLSFVPTAFYRLALLAAVIAALLVMSLFFALRKPRARAGERRDRI